MTKEEQFLENVLKKPMWYMVVLPSIPPILGATLIFTMMYFLQR